MRPRNPERRFQPAKGHAGTPALGEACRTQGLSPTPSPARNRMPRTPLGPHTHTPTQVFQTDALTPTRHFLTSSPVRVAGRFFSGVLHPHLLGVCSPGFFFHEQPLLALQPPPPGLTSRRLRKGPEPMAAWALSHSTPLHQIASPTPTVAGFSCRARQTCAAVPAGPGLALKNGTVKQGVLGVGHGGDVGDPDLVGTLGWRHLGEAVGRDGGPPGGRAGPPSRSPSHARSLEPAESTLDFPRPSPQRFLKVFPK